MEEAKEVAEWCSALHHNRDSTDVKRRQRSGCLQAQQKEWTEGSDNRKVSVVEW